MSTFLERLREEEKELQIKAIKLHEFTHTETFQELSDGNRYLLGKQLYVMWDYIGLLRTRIELIED